MEVVARYREDAWQRPNAWCRGQYSVAPAAVLLCRMYDVMYRIHLFLIIFVFIYPIF